MKLCLKCGNPHNKKGTHCSRTCANSRVWTEEDKKKKSVAAKNSIKVLLGNKNINKRNKVSILLKEHHKSGRINDNYDYLHTNSVIEKVKQTRKAKYLERLKSVDITDKLAYKKACQFIFSLNDYPTEFDFSLIKKYGWYKPKNRGDNLNGVSRDHMYSIKEGYKNGIDPYYIRHPANCSLMKHSDNKIKDSKCTLTKEELFLRVQIWDKKYKTG